MVVLPPRLLFGAAYYHEYLPSYGNGADDHRHEERLKSDLDLMIAANFNVIRVGESVWSTWEPENGQLESGWLEPILDGAHERGMSVILGTPTYAVPPWLARLYPEVTAERASGTRIDWGARQEVDFTHPGFLHHAERVIRAILERYAAHPAVIGFQVDNEPGNELLHNHAVFERFVDHLRRQYGDVETLNREWGLTHWSHRLATWADLWKPDGNAQPQYDVAWREFQAGLVTDFLGWQAGLVREYARPDQFVTTCLSYTRPAVHDYELNRKLDVTAGNAYYVMQDGLALPDRDHHEQGWTTTGVWALHQTADRMYSSRQEPFLVTETNATSIGMPWDNRPAYDGQWRQAAWAVVARGARMIEYWHWHTLPFGAETYWGGVLPHNGQPGRTYRELAALGAEFDTAGELVAGLAPDADVTMVYSVPTKWLMEKYPPLSTSEGRPARDAYHGIFDPFYRGAFDAGRQVRIVHPEQLTDMTAEMAAHFHPVLVVPALYLVDDPTIEWLARYALAGGHLVLGPRTAYADRLARARQEPAPARLVEAAGVQYDEFSNLEQDIPLRAVPGGPLQLPSTATATRWADGLIVIDAAVLVEYDHPHFGRWPAVTSRMHGAGRVTYVGTVPGRDLAESLLAWAAPAVASGWHGLPASVRASTGTSPDGRRVHIVHNWSWATARARVPADLADVLTGDRVAEGDVLELGPWDVRVLATLHGRE
jgi:beta-galactosidase